MKKNELTNLKSKSIAELKTELTKLRKQLLNTNSDLALRKTKNVHERGSVRRDIARVATFLKQKVVAEIIENAAKPEEAAK